MVNLALSTSKFKSNTRTKIIGACLNNVIVVLGTGIIIVQSELFIVIKIKVSNY